MKKSGSITVFTSFFWQSFCWSFRYFCSRYRLEEGAYRRKPVWKKGCIRYLPGMTGNCWKGIMVFMVDGSYGTGVWKPECMYQTVKKCMEESCRPDGAISGVRGENLWKCSSVSGAITAYTLMSDEHGRGYRAQAVDYMKETLGIQGIQLLMEKI